MSAQDVIDAIQDIGFSEFVPQLNAFYQQMKDDKQRKLMAKKAIEKANSGASGSHHISESEDNEDEDEEEAPEDDCDL